MIPKEYKEKIPTHNEPSEQKHAKKGSVSLANLLPDCRRFIWVTVSCKQKKQITLKSSG